MNKYIIVTIMFFALFCSCQKTENFTPSVATNNPLKTDLDKKVNDAMLKYQSELNTVGVSIGIFKNDSLFYYGYGETAKGNAKIPQKTTFFEMGSVTKTFTTIAILNMLKENNETIDQPIRKYLPSDLPTLQRDGIEITFNHLMTHTSGLPYFPDNFGLGLYGSNVGRAFANFDRNKLYTCLKNVRLNFTPATSFEYSNTGMGLLGIILELNYNKTYDAVINEKVLNPLSLTNTKTRKTETNEAGWATGYDAKGKVAGYWESLGAIDGAGCLKTNMIDLVKYGVANLKTPNNALGNAMLQAHTISYLPFEDRGTNKINGRLGWFQVIFNNLPNESFIWHNGGTSGFNTELFVNRNKKTVVAMSFNQDGDTLGGREKLVADLLEIVNK